MYERKIPIDLDCPLRLTMSLIDSKWKSCILDELRYRSMRPSELHKALPECYSKSVRHTIERIGRRWSGKENHIPRASTSLGIFNNVSWTYSYPNY